MKQKKSFDPRILIILIAFISGCSSLVFELVWSRYLNLIFGVSVYAVATVLTCFMLGLALGSWYIGKGVDKSKRPITNLIWLEAGIGIFGLISPLLFAGISELNTWIFQNFLVSDLLKHIIRIMLSFTVLIIPTFLMGGTLPVFIKIYNHYLEDLGNDSGILYAINTFGGVIGAFVTGFFLVQYLGIKNTIYLASSLNLINVGIAFLIFYKIVFQKDEKIKENNIKNESRIPESKFRYSKKIIYLVLVVFAVSGFTSLSYEVYWTRILTLFFRDSIYDFAIVLTAFLFGLVFGSFICGKFLKKIKQQIFSLALIETLIGITSLFCLLLISRLPYLINYLQSMSTMYASFGSNYWVTSIFIKFGYSLLVMLIPTCLFGATYPLVSSIVVNDLNQLGKNFGIINGINTIGATLGSLLAGFIFITLWGTQTSIIITAYINIGIGLTLILYTPFSKKVRFNYIWATVLLALCLMVFIPSWDKLRMSTSFLEPNQPIEEALSLKFYKEDAYGITSVTEFIPYHQKYLSTNRLYSQNTSDMMGLEDHRRLGYIPLILHKNPKSALVIGLGAGVTLRGVCENNLKAIDCVEISGGVREAAKYFAAENGNVLGNLKVNLIIDDGRNYIATNRRKYDVIIGDILFPMSSGSSNMFSLEYFTLCQNHLQPGGLYCQWLPIHQLSLEQLKIIIKTFKKAFPHTSLWYGMIGESVPVIGCIGTNEELSVDYQLVLQKYRDLKFRERLKEINLGEPYLFLSHFIMAEDLVDSFCEEAPINTYDHPVIEFLAPKLFYKSRVQGVSNLLEFCDVPEKALSFLKNTGDQVNTELINKKLTDYMAAKRVIIEGLKSPLEERLQEYKHGLEKYPLNEDLIYSVELTKQILFNR